MKNHESKRVLNSFELVAIFFKRVFPIVKTFTLHFFVIFYKILVMNGAFGNIVVVSMNS